MQSVTPESYIALFLQFEQSVFYGKRWRQFKAYTDRMTFEEIQTVLTCEYAMTKESVKILKERQGKLALL